MMAMQTITDIEHVLVNWRASP